MEPTRLQEENFEEQIRNVSPSRHSEGSGMRRDNESIDDFEHLEPESSPVKEFQGQGLQTKVDKQSSETVSLTGTQFSDGASLMSQNTPDFSFLSSKLESPPEGSVVDENGGAKFTSSVVGAVLGTDTLRGDDNTVSDFPQKLETSDEAHDLLSTVNKHTMNSDVEKLILEAEHPDSKLETDFNGSNNQKHFSEAFMETERKDLSLEGPGSHGDTFDRFMADTDFIKSEKKVTTESDTNIQSQETDKLIDYNIPSSVLPDKNKQFDDFQDSEIHEPSKSDFSLKGKLPEEFGSSKSSLSAHDIDEDDKEIYNLSKDDTTEKNLEPESKPSASITQQEHKISSIPDPIKALSSISEPSVKSETVKTSSPHIKSMLPEGAVQPAVDNDFDEIKPIQLFQYMGLDAWFKPDRLHPKVVELVYWRDPKKSGIVFGSVLGVLLSLSYFSLISVVAYLSLALLTGTISFRIYKNVLQAVQKTSDGHPFKDILELDLTLPQDKVREVTDIAVAHVNAAALELRRLFLVEDLVDSIKFGVLLWCLTYVGSWFNGMTLIIIAFVALFTLPKVYENNKAQIDQNLDVVRSKIADITSKVKAAIPIGKKPAAEEEKKDQ